jgi:hypothetical protein
LDITADLIGQLVLDEVTRDFLSIDDILEEKNRNTRQEKKMRKEKKNRNTRQEKKMRKEKKNRKTRQMTHVENSKS